ncbi:MAG: hypothetical protein HC836_13045 [Richelia sp. RM2_1_2]|nr:hypothetical protein [Richelia sp. RM2_1_2]
MWTEVIKVVDWQTKKIYDLPCLGKNSWTKFLINEGYELIDEVQLGDYSIYLYKTENNTYAIYNPQIDDLDVECLLINILSEQDAYSLIVGIQKHASMVVCKNQTSWI